MVNARALISLFSYRLLVESIGELINLGNNMLFCIGFALLAVLSLVSHIQEGLK